MISMRMGFSIFLAIMHFSCASLGLKFWGEAKNGGLEPTQILWDTILHNFVKGVKAIASGRPGLTKKEGVRRTILGEELLPC